MFTNPLPWFEFRDRVRRGWRVVLSTPTASSYLRIGNCEGYTDKVAHIIVLDIRYPWPRVIATLLHELGHAAADERDLEDTDLEETLVRLLSVPLLEIARHSPFKMQIPPKPKRYAAYRRWALSVDPWEKS